MKEELAPYDSADYLKNAEDAYYYLEAALEEAGDDPAFMLKVLGAVARSGNMTELARKVGVTRESLYKAFSEKGNPSYFTIAKLANSLGLRIRFEAIMFTCVSNQSLADSDFSIIARTITDESTYLT
jgi:probable addiction module antidote protein